MSTSPPEMSWLHAVLVAVIAVVVTVSLLVVIPNEILTRLHGIARGSRVAVASLWFVAALGGVSWALRRLQAHHVV